MELYDFSHFEAKQSHNECLDCKSSYFRFVTTIASELETLQVSEIITTLQKVTEAGMGTARMRMFHHLANHLADQVATAVCTILANQPTTELEWKLSLDNSCYGGYGRRSSIKEKVQFSSILTSECQLYTCTKYLGKVPDRRAFETITL